MDFTAMSQACAPEVHPLTMAAVVQVESGFNPYAIGVVGARLERQPQNRAEAVATAQSLADAGYNFSLGLSQINRHNLPRFGLDYPSAFEPCANLRAGAAILKGCFDRARSRQDGEQRSLQAALSCYYSGNVATGLLPDANGRPSYVQKVMSAGGATADLPHSIRVSRRSPPPDLSSAVAVQTTAVDSKARNAQPTVAKDDDVVLVFH